VLNDFLHIFVKWINLKYIQGMTTHTTDSKYMPIGHNLNEAGEFT
jgi:hypothetical protein